MDTMKNSESLLLSLVLSLLSLHLTGGSAASGGGSGPDHDHASHPRFICTPLPAEADPSCFPTSGPGGSGGSGPSGPGYQNAPPAGWWGASEEAKATILHLRESLVRQKETILDQRETIRELTAKLGLCQGFGRASPPRDERHGTGAHPHHAGVSGHYPYTDHGHHGNQQGHHGNSNLVPDSSHHPSAGGHRADGGHGSSGQGKEKHVAPGDFSSTPEQMERMLQALKERLENLQKRNTSITYSSSLKELLQRKINALEEQLHHQTSALHGPEQHHHSDDDGSHHHDDHERHHDDDDDDEHHHDDHNDGHHDDGHDDGHSDHHGDDGHNDDHHDADGAHEDHDDHHHHHHHHSDHDQDEDEDEDEDDRHGNEADSHSYYPHTGHTGPGPRSGFHSNKLEKVLNQLHFTGSSSKKKAMSPDAFQISFPMRSNYMYGRLKKTLLQEIFAFTLCLWMKAGAVPGLGTPFSYSAPGQANELVLIEWGNNPIELLVDDKAVTLPLSLSDGKWHHVCVTWSTRDGQWEAYQDGVQRGSGINLSPWRPIRPGGVFILGQEQDTLGGRFDAAQSYVGEMSDLHMWSHVLSASDVYGLASCGSYLRGDVIAWSDTEVELHGGVARYPFDPCH